MGWLTTTRASLLSRLRGPSDDDAWREFDARYGALIVRYCHSRGLQFSDAEDVRQIVMLNLAKGLTGFRYDPSRGRFRTYLGRVIRNAISRYCNAPQAIPPSLLAHADAHEVAERIESEDHARWEREWVMHHYRLALSTLQQECDPRAFRAFHQLLDGAAVVDAARENKMTVDAVYKLRQRIRDRLREQIVQQIRIEEQPRPRVAMDGGG